jgi:hypothetical protein
MQAFFDSNEAPAASPPASATTASASAAAPARAAEGVLRPHPVLTLLTTNQPMNIPITQVCAARSRRYHLLETSAGLIVL